MGNSGESPKIIFFGTPLFAADVLTFLLQQGISIVAVITKPDRPKGRSGVPVPTPVKQVAEAHHLPFFQPPLVSDPAFAGILSAFQADLFVVVAYGEIIKQHLLDMPHLGCINLHASLLPQYRGAAPIQRSIIDGNAKTGVTIMHMVKQLDAGDMIKKVEVPIGSEDAFPKVEQALCEAGKRALLDVIKALAAGTATRTPQDHNHATYAPKIELEDCELRWTLPARQLHDLVRGVMPEPGAWCMIQVRGQPKRLKIYETRVIEGKKGQPGEILSYGKEGLVIACGQDALRILELQLEGKKAMSADELMRGLPRDQLHFLGDL